MWKLCQFASTANAPLRYSLKGITTNGSLLSRNSVRKFYTKLQPPKQPPCTKNVNYKLVNIIGSSLTGVGLFKIYSNNNVLCKAQTTRMVGFRKGQEHEIPFNWSMLWHYLKPSFIYFICAIAGALVVAILNIQIPQLMGSVINVISKFTETKDSEIFVNEMKVPALKLIGMYVAQSLFTFAYIFNLSIIGERMAYKMKQDLFASIVRQDIEFFDRQRTGEIINRLTTDIQDFKSSFKQTISGGLRAGTQILGCSVSLFMISPHMTFVTLLCIPTIVAVGTVFGAMLRKTSRRAQSQMEKTTAVADEAVGNIRTVRAFAMEECETNLFDQEAVEAMVLNQKLGLGVGLFQAGTNLFLNGMVLGVVYMGGYLLSTDQLSPGQLMAYLMATQTIQRSLGQMSLLFGSVIRGMASGSRVFEYINMEPRMKLLGGKTIPFHTLRGELEFKDVEFAYPTRSEHTVLDKFTLHVPAGKTVAIVGASGNGKSTVVALLERFYDVKSGSITLDGHDIRTLDPTWLRQRALGLISQEPILFGTTVMENIRYGKPDATDDEVMAAAKMANAHEFIIGFPAGYETMVGERGAALSGGQKQRIAIARALLKKPSVLILDEATSALDTESEKIVQNALDHASCGRTTIVIAHRLSTVKNADLIVVLSKGKIVEMGDRKSVV